MDLAFQSDTFMATTHGSARWASPEETLSAGLLAEEGVVLGVLPDGRLLRDNGPTPGGATGRQVGE